ncbi:MAG: pfkB family carbohydrate kinase [Chloroflexota bacterium]
MIVVIGTLSARTEGSAYGLGGYAASVALAAAAAGEPVEMVSKIGADAAGEAVITKLAAAGIGHVALIRDGALSTALDGAESLLMDAADLQLALRYLTNFDSVLLVDPMDDSVVATVMDACTYVGARLVVTKLVGSSPAGVPAGGPGLAPPPLEVERPADNPGAVTELLVALLLPDRESSAT